MISGEDHSITNSKSAETENSAITQENESRNFEKKRKKKTGKILIMRRLTLMRAITVIIP